MRKVKIAIVAAVLLVGGLSGGYAVADNADGAGGAPALSTTSLIELLALVGLTTSLVVEETGANPTPPASPG